jgi:hypothetical protein
MDNLEQVQACGLETTNQERLLSSLERVFQTLPLCYKRLATFPDLLMVMGGLKAGTDISFLGDTYNEDDWKIFREVFEKEGLRFTELRIVSHEVDESGSPFRQCLIYNPKILQEQTRVSELVLPYRVSESLEEWMERCRRAGKHEDAILGKVYSFPESAINDYIHKLRFPQMFNLLERLNLMRLTTPDSYYHGNETYWYCNRGAKDVQERERKKQAFFRALEKNPRFKAIMESEQLGDSNAEWSRRLPDLNKR